MYNTRHVSTFRTGAIWYCIRAKIITMEGSILDEATLKLIEIVLRQPELTEPLTLLARQLKAAADHRQTTTEQD